MLVDGGPDPARLLDELGATLAPWTGVSTSWRSPTRIPITGGLLAARPIRGSVAIEPEGLSPARSRIFGRPRWRSPCPAPGAARRSTPAARRCDGVGARARPDLRVDVPSLVLLVERGDFSVLFTATRWTTRLRGPRTVAACGHAYVLAASRRRDEHGVACARGPSDAALISVGAGTVDGHPTLATLAALAGILTYRTDQDGRWRSRSMAETSAVRTHANGLPPPRRGFVPHPAARQ
jgi:hypothetical protein